MLIHVFSTVPQKGVLSPPLLPNNTSQGSNFPLAPTPRTRLKMTSIPVLPPNPGPISNATSVPNTNLNPSPSNINTSSNSGTTLPPRGNSTPLKVVAIPVALKQTLQNRPLSTSYINHPNANPISRNSVSISNPAVYAQSTPNPQARSLPQQPNPNSPSDLTESLICTTCQQSPTTLYCKV